MKRSGPIGSWTRYSVQRATCSQAQSSIPTIPRLPPLTRTLPIVAATIDRASRVDPGELRNLDAMHLDAALELHHAGKSDAVLTHDARLRAAYSHHAIPLAIM